MHSSSAVIDEGIYTSVQQLLRTRRAARELDLFKHRLARSMLFGEVRSRFRGRGMEFEEVRLYQPGDDVRNIDWRVSARTGKPHTKLFAEERELPVHIVVDQRTPMFFGSGKYFKSVIAAQLAASIAWAALAGSDRIGGQVIGAEQDFAVRAKRNKHAVLKLIHDIVTANQALPGDAGASLDLAHILEECRRLTRPGTVVFIISDFFDMDKAAAQSLHLLGSHRDVVLIRVVDELELSLNIDGKLGISDGKSVDTLVMSQTLRGRFRDAQSQRFSELKVAATQARASLSQITTNEEPFEYLLRLSQK